MNTIYDYKFVRIGEQSGSNQSERTDYQEVIHVHAKQGWRLVQVLAPPIGMYGVAPYYELIFEKEAAP